MKNKICCFLLIYSLAFVNGDSVYKAKVTSTTNTRSTTEWPESCNKAMKRTHQSGIYEIQLPAFGPEPFEVLCDNEKHGGNWTVVMRRFDGSVDFDRSWAEYKDGFGNLSGEFFIGLERLHVMTSSQGRQDMLILMEDIFNRKRFVLFNFFTLGNEGEGYKIKELDYEAGTIPSFLVKNVEFSTKDNSKDHTDCLEPRSKAGWHKFCFETNLFGTYGADSLSIAFKWLDRLQSVEMLIKPHE